MSNEEPLPFVETKSPPVGVVGHEHRLHRGALGIMDISAATMANIGPAMSFFFGFGLIATTAGLASPLTIVAAVVAIALLGNTLAQFSRAQPSTGGFITFVGKTFGGTSAVSTALIAGIGYIIAMSSVIAISGGFLSTTLDHYLHWNIPWGILTVVAHRARGVHDGPRSRRCPPSWPACSSASRCWCSSSSPSRC